MVPKVLKIFLILIIFYFLVLIQISFLPFFTIFSKNIHLILILIIVINLIEKPKGKVGLYSAIFGGIFLDISSSYYFLGFNTAVFLAISIFLKLILLRYVKLPSFQKFPEI
ncbi:MAG: hypothetical protein COX88_00930 [Candidatus Nealsonbacteria bacterium CG_4_10_14_0_2_um_filter_35_20]|nr:MAG: hypothetical protein COX88_00930 [Candidatus Nealsonbacteria bacterium CG_4_10_14_0_2_um_filter_35_20]